MKSGGFFRLTGDRDRDYIRKNWASMSLAAKIRYIFFYYGVAILCAAALAVMIVFFVKDYRTKKQEIGFYVMAIDCGITEEEAGRMQDRLAEALEIDPDSGRVLVETGYATRSAMQTEATVLTYMQSGEVDLLVAPEDVFNKYAVTGYLAPLSAEMYGELLAGRADGDLFFASQVDYSQGGAVRELPFAPHDSSGDCYGIYLDGSISGNGIVAGVMVNAPNEDRAVKGLSLILEQTG